MVPHHGARCRPARPRRCARATRVPRRRRRRRIFVEAADLLQHSSAGTSPRSPSGQRTSASASNCPRSTARCPRPRFCRRGTSTCPLYRYARICPRSTLLAAMPTSAARRRRAPTSSSQSGSASASLLSRATNSPRALGGSWLLAAQSRDFPRCESRCAPNSSCRHPADPSVRCPHDRLDRRLSRSELDTRVKFFQLHSPPRRDQLFMLTGAGPRCGWRIYSGDLSPVIFYLKGRPSPESVPWLSTPRGARLKRNLQLEEISDQLKISTRLLDAIENDQYEKLPEVFPPRALYASTPDCSAWMKRTLPTACSRRWARWRKSRRRPRPGGALRPSRCPRSMNGRRSAISGFGGRAGSPPRFWWP